MIAHKVRVGFSVFRHVQNARLGVVAIHNFIEIALTAIVGRADVKLILFDVNRARVGFDGVAETFRRSPLIGELQSEIIHTNLTQLILGHIRGSNGDRVDFIPA